MPRCPFAVFEEISGPVGAFVGGPFKVVHHTTEGSTYAGAKAAYKANRSDPHFTVAGEDIFQHIDTGLAARSLRNQDGGVQTNRDSAVQIEVVGFAGRAKDIPTLRSVAKLCRWIEQEHSVPQTWPNGKPRASTNGHDPGGHNRTAATWDQESGHYGHSQVPENTHWDPGYTAAELAIVTPDAVFDAHQELAFRSAPAAALLAADEPGRTETAETIVERLIARLAAVESQSAAPPSRLDVRVATAGVEVRVVLERRSEGPVKSIRTSRDRRRHAKARRR